MNLNCGLKMTYFQNSINEVFNKNARTPERDKMKTEILFIISMVAVFTIGSHLHDAGRILGDDGKSIATNGFYNIDVSRLFHIGWYMMYLTFFALVVAYVVLFSKISSQQNK